MKYEVGDKVVLEDWSAIGTIIKVNNPVDYSVKFKGASEEDKYKLITEGLINHDKTAELNEEKNNNVKIVYGHDRQMEWGKLLNKLSPHLSKELAPKEQVLNHYSGELEKIVAEKNKIHQGSTVETKFMTNKIDRHKELTDYMHQTYIRKNKDYGDSFGQTHEKYGAVAGLVRIADKFHRLENIILNDREIQVEDESIIDTLIDMSNYGLLLAMELEEE